MNEDAAPRRGAAPQFSRRAAAVLLAVAAAAAVLALLALVRQRRAPAGAATAPDAPATLTVASADVRAQPRADSRSIERIARGARLKVLSDRGEWIEVKTPRNAVGFLPTESLERDSDRESREKRAKTILGYPPVFGVVAEDTDILLAPFPLAPRAGTLAKGATIRVHAVDHAYYAIRTSDGGLGFVESSRTDLVPADPHEPAIPESDARPLKNLTVTDLELPVDAASPGEETNTETLVPDVPPIRAAVLDSRVDPVYPEPARRAGADGTVVLDAVIGADGRVAGVRVVSGQPFGMTEAAVAAVKRWHYRAALGPNGPIPSRKEIRIVFRLGR